MMLVSELLNELTFQGSTCTKDCSGHSAGYKWAMDKKPPTCSANNRSFNNGCNIAVTQLQQRKIIRPKVRTPQGRFATNPVV
jgi:hypothetical protein